MVAVVARELESVLNSQDVKEVPMKKNLVTSRYLFQIEDYDVWIVSNLFVSLLKKREDSNRNIALILDFFYSDSGPLSTV